MAKCPATSKNWKHASSTPEWIGRTIVDRENDLQATKAQLQELSGQQDQLRSEYNRLRQEAQDKIDKLSVRIKELNQRIINGG